jgi:hypothetical protein
MQGKSSNLGGSKIGDDAFEAGLNPVSSGMPSKKLSLLTSEMNKKARTKRG